MKTPEGALRARNQLITVASLSVISFLFIAILLVVGLNSAVVKAQAVTTPPDAPEAAAVPAAAAADLPRTITVVGEGKITIKPDIAQTNIGVEVIAPTVKEASTQAADTMAAVLAALEAQGIAERDVQTTGYNVWLERPYTPEGLPSDKTLYHMGNNVMVTIRDLDKIGAILDAAIEAGANNIYGVTFNVADPNELKGEGRQEAVADALAKAQELAELNQQKLGAVISISEVIGGNGGYYPGNFGPFFAQAAGLGGGGGGPIVPGELNLTVQVQITYAIE